MAGIVDGGRSFLNSLPVVGGVFEGLFGSPEQEAHQAELAKVKAAYEAYRPEMQANRFGAMQNQSAAFMPMQNLMGQMYGPGAQMDFSKIVQNPFQHSPQTHQPSAGQAAFGPRMKDQGGQLPAGNFDYRNYQDFGG